MQLELPQNGDSLLFVYRLDDGSPTKTFRLRNLDRNATYHVVPHAMADLPTQEHTGTKLRDDGIRVGLPQRFRAAVYVVRKTWHGDGD